MLSNPTKRVIFRRHRGQSIIQSALAKMVKQKKEEEEAKRKVRFSHIN